MNVRDLVFLNENDVWSFNDNASFDVVFEDNVVLPMLGKHIKISWYYWLMYRCYPTVPIISLTAVSGDFHSSTHNELGSTLVQHVFYYLKDSSPDYLLWHISEIFLEINSLLFNMTAIKLSKYITSASMYDVTEILNDPMLLTAKEEYNVNVANAKGNEEVIDKEIKKVYKTLSTLLYTDKYHLKDNGIKKLCLAGIVNHGQIMQMFAPRGLVTDADGYLLPHQIDVGYAEGLSTLYDSLAESRSACRASLAVEKPLQDAEYFKRKVELAATSVTHTTKGSCTEWIAVPWLVKEDEETLLCGKYHMSLPDDGSMPKLMHIRNVDDYTPLIGKVIQLRSSMGCGNHNTQTVCEICFGSFSAIMPPNTNVGFYTSIEITAPVSQSIMSTKHLERTTISKKLELDSASSKWLKFKEDRESLYLNDTALSGTLILRIEDKQFIGINQLLHTDAEALPPDRISNIYIFEIAHESKDGEILGCFDTIHLDNKRNGVNLSTPALKFISKIGWEKYKNIIEIRIPLHESTFKHHPLFITSKMSENMMTFFNSVESFIAPRNGDGNGSGMSVTDYQTRAGALQAFVGILNRRLNKDMGQEYNIIGVEIILRSLMVNTDVPDAYDMPHTSNNFVFKTAGFVTLRRSLISMLLYQYQATNLIMPHWFSKTKKNVHMLDPLISISPD